MDQRREPHHGPERHGVELGDRKLGFQPDKIKDKIKATNYFVKGMKNQHSITALQDPEPKDWEKEYQVDIDAMVLLCQRKQDPPE